MKTRILAFICFFLSAWGVWAQNSGEEHYYLTIDEVANSVRLLPPPPKEGSARFEYDREMYEYGKTVRASERGKTAVADANTSSKGISAVFSEAFGMEISCQHTPEIYELINHMREDAGDLATRHAKQHYQRIRPFDFFQEDTSLPQSQKAYSANGSYPSGHTAIGWAVALVLAEINPARQEEILLRGLEMGQSRVISGFHYQSDVDAARIVAAGVVARLHADKKFSRQLKKAKREFRRLSRQVSYQGSPVGASKELPCSEVAQK